MISSPQMLIAARWIDGARSDSISVLNPATGQPVARFNSTEPEQIDDAIASISNSFPSWRDTDPGERASRLLAAAEAIRRRASEIATLLTMEQGKPLKESLVEVERAARFIAWDAGETVRTYGVTLARRKNYNRFTLLEPIGPVLAISPWNFPISTAARKLGAALAAGCTAILKPSEETPLSAACLVECLIEGGIPPEALGLVYGDPVRIISQMIAHPAIRVVSFTGSTHVGKLIAEQAARVMKPALLELGGHAPVVVCKDADPVEVAQLAARAKFRNAGQICTCPTRFIVHTSIYEVFLEAMTSATETLRIGNGLDASSDMGPVVNERRAASIQALVDDALAHGARVLTGGKPPENATGSYFLPTVLADVSRDSEIMKNEPFGPVAPVLAYDDIEEAVSIANDVEYGLCAYCFTEDTGMATTLTQSIECGLLSINHFGSSEEDTPFGGVKDSGYGREGGHTSLAAYLTTKTVSQRARIQE